MKMSRVWKAIQEFFAPHRYSDEELVGLTQRTRDTAQELHDLADKFDEMNDRAKSSHRDPFAVLVQEVRNASIHKRRSS